MLLIVSLLGMSEKSGNFFQNMRTMKSRNMWKLAGIAYSRKSDMVHFWGDEIAQPLFSTFKLIAKLESTRRHVCVT